MPNQKISELTAIVTVDTSLDVLPIVDTSANTTKKISPTALKTALALDNVNNTSDANKPVSTAQQDALNAKVTGNTAIVAATKTKITYDAKGLVTAGNILDAADMPMAINAANIGTGVVSSTEFGYLDGVTSAIQTQLDAKQATLVSATNIKTINSTSLLGSGDVAVQATLVSGTNIKTINSTSLLGSGDIVISASPSGVAGAIQFSNGSAFASDAANLFWDDTNNRLGVGTNVPLYGLDVSQNINGDIFARLRNTNAGGFGMLLNAGDGVSAYSLQWANYLGSGGGRIYPNGVYIGQQSAPTARLQIQGSGSTSATTSLLVQNSAGTERFKIQDDGTTTFNGGLTISTNGGKLNSGLTQMQLGTDAARAVITYSNNTAVVSAKYFTGNIGLIVSDSKTYGDASDIALNVTAVLQADSTTRGFLPPRMTTTQINAIASPANGLEVYNTTLACPCFYDGTAWRKVSHTTM